VSTCHRRKAGRKRCRVGTMSLATSCDITRHHAIGSGSGSGAGGVRCHSTEGIAEERRGGGSGSGRQAGVGRRAGVRSVRGSPYTLVLCELHSTESTIASYNTQLVRLEIMHSTSRLLSTCSGSLKRDTPHLSACWGLGRV